MTEPTNGDTIGLHPVQRQMMHIEGDSPLGTP